MQSLGEFTFSDPSLRLVREADGDAIARLFHRAYDSAYPFRDVFDGTWVKRCVHGDDAICVVLSESDAVIATCSVLLNRGDYNDRLGELARLVVDEAHQRRGAGRRVVAAALEAADDFVDFVVAEARTSHQLGQVIAERSGFTAIGFVPEYHPVSGRYEGQVIYGRVSERGRDLRSARAPMLIPEIAPLARHVLAGMGLPVAVEVVAGDRYTAGPQWHSQPYERRQFAPLVRVQAGRLVDPLLFGGMSLDQGESLMRQRQIDYAVALDEAGEPVGAVGYRYDAESGIFTGTELIGEDRALRGYLCGLLLETAAAVGARLIEVVVSAYDADLQRTFYDCGLRPAAYAPAMVFHLTHRLDAIRMVRLDLTGLHTTRHLTPMAEALLGRIEADVDFVSDGS